MESTYADSIMAERRTNEDGKLYNKTRNILDGDQSNYSSRIIFSCRPFLQADL